MNHYFKVEITLRYILKRRQKYFNYFQNKLCDIIFNNLPNNNEWEEINQLANSYATLCISNGLSMRYVFSHLCMLLRITNYGVRTVREQLLYVTKMLYEDCRFTCVFSLSYKGEQFISNAIPSNISIDNTVINPPSSPHRLKISIETRASDYISAAFSAQQVLCKFLNSNQFKFAPQIDDGCTTIRLGSTAHKNEVNIVEHIHFLTSKSGTIFSKSEFHPEEVFDVLDDTSRNYWERSLRYHFLANDTCNLEQKFLSLWIALESLFVNISGNIIGKISEIVPLVYATTSLKYRLLYLKNLLIENRIHIPNANVSAGTPSPVFYDSISDSEFLHLISSERDAEGLFNTLGDMNHLKYRVRKTSELFSDKQAIMRQIEKSKIDVKHQLNRIYYFRNLIAHAGYNQGIPLQLITHLLDYVYSTYYALSVAAKTQADDKNVSLQKLFFTYSVGCDYFMDNLENSMSFPLDDINCLTPTIV